MTTWKKEVTLAIVVMVQALESMDIKLFVARKNSYYSTNKDTNMASHRGQARERNITIMTLRQCLPYRIIAVMV